MIASAIYRTVLAAGLASMLHAGSAAQIRAGHDPLSLEAPELGRAGDYQIGTSRRQMQLKQRVLLTHSGTTQSDRIVGLRFWYPARSGNSRARAVYRHSLKISGMPPREIIEQGKAFEGALPAKGTFPLVIISHGFGGWGEHLSRLGEHLASRGYVVASIDHDDMPFDSLSGFRLAFGNVMIGRSLDQREVIQRLVDRVLVKDELALASADPSRIALIGYSMGGFGALATAGAKYESAAQAFASLPQTAKGQAIETGPGLKVHALVLIAPWGGQPDSRAWTNESLASVSTPTLLISGDQDDVVNFGEGVRWLFDGLTGADRHLLIYREARHNIAGNPFDLGDEPSFDAIGYSREPVWRQERLNQINQHFVTAFLDSILKKDNSRRLFLDVPTPVASDGKWPSTFGQSDDGAYAGDGQQEYWRGFQRRWATGLELHRKSANTRGKQ